MTDLHRIIVGYDGSDFSMQALDWAMDECELRELPLTVTHAWRWPGQSGGRARRLPRRHRPRPSRRPSEQMKG